MSDAPRIVRRKCPDCGAPLLASSGVAWMPCSACPVAVNLFRAPIERVRCRRVVSSGETSIILPFFRFQERWVPAFRNAGTQSYAMASALERNASKLHFIDGPCDVPLGRGLDEARSLLGLTGEAELIAVPCIVNGDVVTDPLTGCKIRSAAATPPLP